MGNNKKTIEKRLQAVKDFYFKLDDLLNMLPDVVTDEVKSKLKEIILNDEELKRLMQGMEENRPPRFLVVGRTGVGKSSLINAICGMCVAEVSNVRIGTKEIEKYLCKEGERILLEVLDTRGIGESISSDENSSAEEVLRDGIIEFHPDAILFVLNCERDRVNVDAEYVNELQKFYQKKTNVKIPVIAILNKADRVAPEEYKDPKEYPHRKIENMQKVCEEDELIFRQVGLQTAAIIPVSSSIDWGYDFEEIAQMPPKEREKLEIKVDRRYNIQKLIDELEKNLEVDASMGLLFAAGLNEAVARIAKKFVAIFSTIAGAIAVVPIPIAGIAVLSALEVLMVMLIAYLSGEELNVKAAEKFIGSVAGIGIGGNIFRLTARELSKLVPIAGSFISASVASSGVLLIGKAAIQYYIYGIPMKKIAKGKNDEGKNKK